MILTIVTAAVIGCLLAIGLYGVLNLTAPVPGWLEVAVNWLGAAAVALLSAQLVWLELDREGRDKPIFYVESPSGEFDERTGECVVTFHLQNRGARPSAVESAKLSVRTPEVGTFHYYDADGQRLRKKGGEHEVLEFPIGIVESGARLTCLFKFKLDTNHLRPVGAAHYAVLEVHPIYGTRDRSTEFRIWPLDAWS